MQTGHYSAGFLAPSTYFPRIASKTEVSAFIIYSNKETLFCDTQHLPHEHACECHGPALSSLWGCRLRYIARREDFPGAADLAYNTDTSKGMWKCIFVSPDPATAPALLSSHLKWTVIN